jgi:hypothetical protein
MVAPYVAAWIVTVDDPPDCLIVTGAPTPATLGALGADAVGVLLPVDAGAADTAEHPASARTSRGTASRVFFMIRILAGRPSCSFTPKWGR